MPPSGAAMAGGRTLTPAFLKELCVTLGGGDRGEVEEDFANWHVTALAVGAGRVPTDVPALKRAVERLKPAHLSVTVLPTADLTAHRWEAVTRRCDAGGLGVKKRGETGEARRGRMKRACFRGWPPKQRICSIRCLAWARRWKAKRRRGRFARR